VAAETAETPADSQSSRGRLAAALIVGIWVPQFSSPAAIGMAVLMVGAVSMHVKVKDPLQRSLPASCMLALSLIVAFA
jgi:hypothetical protein